MSVVVTDAGPPRYLVLIDHIDILPFLFGDILLPDVVRHELSAPRTPSKVLTWLASSPSWLKSGSARPDAQLAASKLDDGERATIALAIEVGASLVLMDDRAGVEEARARGLQVTGTLGVLLLAARRGTVDLEKAISSLQTTNFRSSPSVLEAVLATWRAQRNT